MSDQNDDLHERLKLVPSPVDFLVNLFTHAPVAFAVWRIDGSVLLTNHAFFELFGSRPPPDYNVFKDDVVAKSGMLALFERVFFHGETVNVPTFWYDPRDLQSVKVSEGKRVAISMTIFPLFNQTTNKVEYVAATYKDQTAIMAVQEQLQVGQERQRLAHQAARIGTFEWRIDEDVNEWSPELEAMYGLTPGEFGKTQGSWEGLVHPDDLASAKASVKAALKCDEPVEGEWRVVWPDRSVHWVVGRFRAVRDATGKARRLIGVNVDITGRKEAEDEVRRLNENLEQLVQARTAELSAANRELEAFSYSVAHDLRSPLRGMSGFASILLEDYADKLDAQAVRYLDKIRGNAILMSNLIDALLSLSRVTRSQLHPTYTDLTALARSIVEQLTTPAATRSGPSFVLNVEEEIPPTFPHPPTKFIIEEGLEAFVDPTLARTLLENLIGNAWKFTKTTKEPLIEFGRAKDGSTFFVKDNGVGFDMSHASKLFTPFRRLHDQREFPGTGVGLATCHRIAERHGGQIRGEAREGEGATFFFTFPPPATPPRSTSATPPPRD